MRTLATATVSFENTFLYDLGCYKKDDLVWFEAADEQVAAKLSEILVIGVTYRARLDLTGKFEVSKSGGFGHVNGYRYQFVITHVNRVESIPANELWPYELKTSSK
ncbi:MAG: hypothetical protein ABIP75_00030 [Pyrinomonadaceae bacterium]